MWILEKIPKEFKENFISLCYLICSVCGRFLKASCQFFIIWVLSSFSSFIVMLLVLSSNIEIKSSSFFGITMNEIVLYIMSFNAPILGVMLYRQYFKKEKNHSKISGLVNIFSFFIFIITIPLFICLKIFSTLEKNDLIYNTTIVGYIFTIFLWILHIYSENYSENPPDIKETKKKDIKDQENAYSKFEQTLQQWKENERNKN